MQKELTVERRGEKERNGDKRIIFFSFRMAFRLLQRLQIRRETEYSGTRQIPLMSTMTFRSARGFDFEDIGSSKSSTICVRSWSIHSTSNVFLYLCAT